MADYQMVLLRVHETASKFEGLAIFRKSFFLLGLTSFFASEGLPKRPKMALFLSVLRRANV